MLDTEGLWWSTYPTVLFHKWIPWAPEKADFPESHSMLVAAVGLHF